MLLCQGLSMLFRMGTLETLVITLSLLNSKYHDVSQMLNEQEQACSKQVFWARHLDGSGASTCVPSRPHAPCTSSVAHMSSLNSFLLFLLSIASFSFPLPASLPLFPPATSVLPQCCCQNDFSKKAKSFSCFDNFNKSLSLIHI